MLNGVFCLLDAPRVSNVTEDSCLVEWSAVKMATSQHGEIKYKVQITKNRETEPKKVQSETLN